MVPLDAFGGTCHLLVGPVVWSRRAKPSTEEPWLAVGSLGQCKRGLGVACGQVLVGPMPTGGKSAGGRREDPERDALGAPVVRWAPSEEGAGPGPVVLQGGVVVWPAGHVNAVLVRLAASVDGLDEGVPVGVVVVSVVLHEESAIATGGHTGHVELDVLGDGVTGADQVDSCARSVDRAS